MWNDTDEPLAIFVTFRTYGTWLPGDDRGTINRHHNKYGTKKIRPVPEWVTTNKLRMNREPVALGPRQRATVRKAIKEACRFRGWRILSINVRTNHIHVVVATGQRNGSKVVNSFKANGTRMMRERGLWKSEGSPWVDKGSTRYLWNGKSVNRACDYVEYGQGDDLPEFD
ncbi:MAG: transposase [Blastocatellia bacterium]|nr:transposase [Blastocatellia bacterium]